MMQLLVEVETMYHGMGAAHAVEESLRDQITFLEAQIGGTKATFRCVVSASRVFSLIDSQD